MENFNPNTVVKLMHNNLEAHLSSSCFEWAYLFYEQGLYNHRFAALKK